jgi:quercetin dioxygenase-like cupin family protein
MKTYDISDFKGGWLIGNFEPAVLKTSKFELGIHTYSAGYVGQKHYHKLSNEYNYIVSGKVFVNYKELGPGNMFVFEPHEISDCQFLEDTTIVVVRDYSDSTDKYLV